MLIQHFDDHLQSKLQPLFQHTRIWLRRDTPSSTANPPRWYLYVQASDSWFMRLVGKLTGEEDANVPVWKGAWQHRAACVPKLFFFVVGLVGGRFAMKLTARQLGSVVIGSFLVTFVAAVGSVYPSVPSEPT